MRQRRWPVWFGLAGVALAPRADAGVVLNEIFADATSTDANCDGVLGTSDDEFVEIVNAGPSPVDLSGATLSDAGAVQYTFAGGTLLGVGEAIVVFAGGTPMLDGSSASAEPWCAALPPEVRVVTTSGLSLNNTGDTVTLADSSGTVLDSHTYGSEANADKSVVRDPELTGAAWVVHGPGPVSPGTRASGAPFGAVPPDTGDTGGAPSPDTGDTGGSPVAGSVRINEFLPNPSGADGGNEWLEIVNVGPGTIQLDGWTIQRATSGSPTVRYTFPALAIAPGARLVVGESAVVGADLVSVGTLDLGNATSSADVVRLVDARGTVADTVVYGPANTDGFVDDSGTVATSLAPSPVDGMSLSRVPDGRDTDLSADDFQVTSPTLGAANGGGGGTDTGLSDTGLSDTGPAGPSAVGLVVVNEFLPNPSGADGGYEWVELLNLGPDPVELAGWTIRRATSGSPSVRFTFPAYAMAPGERLVVGDAYVLGAHFVSPTNLDFGNASSSADLIQLVDPLGAVSDAVVYGPANTDGFVDDNGTVATSLAPSPVDAMTLSRVPDGQDTDLSADDFQVTSPTLGAANLAPSVHTGDTGTGPVQTPSPFAGTVVVNEFLPDPSGTDTGNEWVELLNVSGAAVNLDGWALERAKTSWGVRHTFAGTVLPAGGRLVVGEEYVVQADIVPEGTLDLGNGSSNGDAVRLVDDAGLAVDTVVYGPDNADGIVDDHGTVAVSIAPKPVGGASLARVPDGVDTQDAGVDFLVIGEPTPGQPNLDPGDLCSDGAEADGVVINEFDTVTTGQEWVEVYNAGSQIADLTGWAFVFGTSSFSSRVPIPAGTTLEPGAFLVLGAIPTADVMDDLGMGNASSSSDGMRLEDCVGGVIDTVVYGQPNSDALVDDSGEVATSLAPTPLSGATIARGADGRDTDRSGEDFVVQPEPTPGAPNPEVVPVVCVPTTGVVFVNEVFPDPDGADEGNEWVELYNAGDTEVSVAGWWISAGTKDFDDVSVTLPGGTTIPAGDWLVIGGDGVDAADVVFNVSLGNGTGGDGVRLFDCAGAVVDTALYGDSAEDLLPDDNGEIVPPYADVGEASSLARVADGVDTNTAEDWDERGSPTPGASNVQEAGSGVSAEVGGGCGCAGNRNQAPSNDAPPAGAPGQGGCATVPLPLRGFEFLIALVAARRRRR